MAYDDNWHREDLSDLEWELATEEDEWEGYCRDCREPEDECSCKLGSADNCDDCGEPEDECSCEDEHDSAAPDTLRARAQDTVDIGVSGYSIKS